jgi:alanine-glyoxylate transaminase / serine-glyoxylate transaminase / serine-pyruvate transaminase
VRDHPALFVVDTVTSLSGMPVDVDGWGIDVAYSGAQKCLSVPPGLSPITFSDRAMDAARSRKAPARSWYLDVTLIDGFLTDRVYHHTPPISMLRALHAGLGSILDEGLAARWERHERAASLLSEGLLDRGFTYVPPEGHRLPMLHCVRLPDGVDDAAGRSALLNDYGIEVSGGIGDFKGTCWRIGLMGYNATEQNVRTLLAALDDVLQR